MTTWRLAGKLLNSLWLLLAVLVIALAIVVALGRELLPHANRYQAEVTAFFSARAGLPITADSLQGAWKGFAPRLVARGVVIHSPEGAQAIAIDEATAQLDLLRTLVSFAPVWRELEASGVVVTAVEDADGGWSVAGIPLGGGNGSGLDSIRQLLVKTRLLRIADASLDLQFYAGVTARLRAPEARIDNVGSFHRTVARLAVADNGDDAARLIFEGREGAGEGGTFSGRGYVEVHRLNFDGNLSAIARRWFPEQVERVGDIQTDIDLALWFDWRNGGLVNGRGTLKAAEIPLNWVAEAGSLTELEAAITAWYQPGADWGARLQDLRMNWGGETIGPINVELRQRVGRRWGELDLMVDSLDLALTHRLMHSTELLSEWLDGVLAQLEPTGVVRGLQLDIDISTATPGVVVRGTLDDVSVGAWRGAPAARHVNGYFEVEAEGGGRGARGFVELDSPEGLALHYTRVYSDYMPYGATRGRVDWWYRPDRQQVEVNSGPIAINGEEGQGTVWLYLDIPTRAGLREPQMYLMVTLRNSEARFVERYLPATLPEALSSWLDNALGEGAIPEAGFLWRGTLAAGHPAGRTLQVYARVEDATLDYQPGWPALSGVTATLLVDDNDVDVWVDTAAVGEGDVRWAHADMRAVDGGGQLLRIRGDVDASVDYGLKVLRASPIGTHLDALDAWQVAGGADIAVDLHIPLGGAAAEDEYRVEVAIEDGRLSLPGGGVDVEAIEGSVAFSLAQGLVSPGLNGRFLGQPVKAVMDTRDQVTVIDLDSRLPAEAFAPYLGIPLAFVGGEADFAGQLRIPGLGRSPELRLVSDLQGLAVHLPPPFAKAVEETRSLEGLLTFRGEELLIEGKVEDTLALALRFEGGRFNNGVAELLRDSARLPAEPGLLVRGTLERLDWSQWQPVLTGEGMESASRDEDPFAESFTPEMGSLSPRLDILVGEFDFGGVSLGETRIVGRLQPHDRWQLSLTSERVAGEIKPGGARTRVNLDYLHLPSLTPEDNVSGAGQAERDGTELQALDRFDPRQFPALDFSVDHVTLGGNELGSLAFRSTPLVDGVRLDNIHGSLRGLILPDAEAAEALELAELEWRIDGDRHHTRFAGTLLVGDFAATLQNWQLQPLIDSRDASFHLELAWPQRPWEFSLASLEGHIGIDLANGQFHRAAGAPTNAFLRLISLLNFDTWLRRLRFDFSDLFNQGVSFDHLSGGLVFEGGILRFDDPIVAVMPSGRVRLLGRADMIEEQLDARLVATLPVGTNLPWVAGVLGGLPAAAGVYVTGRLFRRQVDQLSSLSYRVTGPWDDPKLEVDKIFSDRTDLEEE